MAKLHLPSTVGAGTVDWQKGANGSTPSGAILRRAADGMNTIATYNKKLLQAKSQDFSNRAVSGVLTVNPWPFYFRTGENTTGVRCVLGIFDTDYAGFTSPHVDVSIYEVSGGTVVVTKSFYYNGRNAPTNAWETFNRTHVVNVLLDGLDANTEYYCAISVVSRARLICLSAYEVADPHADDSVAGVVDPSKFLTDGPIYDEHVSDLLGAGDLHWRHGGCHYLSWNPDYASIFAWTATTYTNVIDSSSTSYSAASPGVTLAAQYHGTATTSSAGPAVKMAVQATRVSGGGTLDVKLTDGTNTISVTGISTGGVGDWYTATGHLPSAKSKWDIMAKVSAGTFDISAVCLFAYESSSPY